MTVERILMTTDSVGGVWHYSVDLARGLSDLGVETVLAVLGPPPSPDQRAMVASVERATLAETGHPLDWLADDPGQVAAAGAAVAELARRHDVDLVHLNAPALAVETRFDRPLVAMSHGCLATWWAAVKGTRIEPAFAWRAELIGKGLAAADATVSPTAAFARVTRDAYRLEKTPLTVHNGRSPLPLPAVAQHDFAFTVGRLWDRAKNVVTLDRAAARLAIPLHAAGPLRGPSGDGIALRHIDALGTLSEAGIAERLAARPVFVSAAVHEPFGLAVLEAAAAGCALVLSDIPTFRELWHGVAAFVDPTDDESFAETIDLTIRDDFARAEMGRLAQARAAEFSMEAMAAKMSDIYADLARKAEPAALRAMVPA